MFGVIFMFAICALLCFVLWLDGRYRDLSQTPVTYTINMEVAIIRFTSKVTVNVPIWVHRRLRIPLGAVF